MTELPRTVTLTVDAATAQTLLDWNVLDFTDNGWTLDLDIWRQHKAARIPAEPSEDEVERVARAIRESLSYADVVTDEWKDAARAALAAMRPNERGE